MFSWINKDDRRKHEPEVYASVAEGLRKLYQQVHCTQLCYTFTSFICVENQLELGQLGKSLVLIS